jgi:hypothetical protein
MVDPDFVFYIDEVWFHLRAYMNGHNSRYWSAEYPLFIHEVPLYDVNIGVRCVISAH